MTVSLNAGASNGLWILLLWFLKYTWGATQLASTTRSLSGPGRMDGPVSGRLCSSKGLTSPSHLFFPFLQAVQARAPRLGICACGWLPPPCPSGSERPISFVLRLFDAVSEPFDTDADGLNDMMVVEARAMRGADETTQYRPKLSVI